MNINTHWKNIIMKERSGFTLIEVMIALTILAVGLLALATMQIVSIRGNAFSTEMTYATMLAQSRLEQLRNTPYASIPPTGGTPLTVPIPATATSKGIPYTIERSVDFLNDDPDTNMKLITLVVRWTGAPAGTSGQTTVQFRTTFTTVIKR
jgi:prepilin-type N-terminal cleavage/methylation domain-containing protein